MKLRKSFLLTLSVIVVATNSLAATQAEIEQTLKYVRENPQSFADDGSSEFIADSLNHFLYKKKSGDSYSPPIYEEVDYKDALQSFNQIHKEKNIPYAQIISESLLDTLAGFRNVNPSAQSQASSSVAAAAQTDPVSSRPAPPNRIPPKAPSLEASALKVLTRPAPPTRTPPKVPSLKVSTSHLLTRPEPPTRRPPPIPTVHLNGSVGLPPPAAPPIPPRPNKPVDSKVFECKRLGEDQLLSIRMGFEVVAPVVEKYFDPDGLDFEWDQTLVREEE